MIIILLCVLYCVERTSAEEHTLKYLYTLRSAPEDDPEFEITTVFDGLIISHCNSPSFRDQSRHDWISQAFTAEEWRNRDLFCQNEYHFHKTLKKQIEDAVNTTKEIIQRERSCTEGDSGVYMRDRWGVNGEDFLTLDQNTLKWSSDAPLARTISSDWNQMTFMTPSLKDFELNQCKPSLMKLKKTKADYLKENTPPEASIFGKPSRDGDAVYLRCYVSHKYLPGVHVQLSLDGVMVENVNISRPAPNMDGSVQIRLEKEISVNETDSYLCVVDTNNLHITKEWNGRTLDNKMFFQGDISDEHIFSKVSISLILLIAIVGIIFSGIMCIKGDSFAWKKHTSKTRAMSIL